MFVILILFVFTRLFSHYWLTLFYLLLMKLNLTLRQWQNTHNKKEPKTSTESERKRVTWRQRQFYKLHQFIFDVVPISFYFVLYFYLFYSVTFLYFASCFSFGELLVVQYDFVPHRPILFRVIYNFLPIPTPVWWIVVNRLLNKNRMRNEQKRAKEI